MALFKYFFQYKSCPYHCVVCLLKHWNSFLIYYLCWSLLWFGLFSFFFSMTLLWCLSQLEEGRKGEIRPLYWACHREFVLLPGIVPGAPQCQDIGQSVFCRSQRRMFYWLINSNRAGLFCCFVMCNKSRKNVNFYVEMMLLCKMKIENSKVLQHFKKWNDYSWFW